MFGKSEEQSKGATLIIIHNQLIIFTGTLGRERELCALLHVTGSAIASWRLLFYV